MSAFRRTSGRQDGKYVAPVTAPSRAELWPAVAALVYSLVEVFVLGPTNLVGPLWGLGASSAAASVFLIWRIRRPLVVQVAVGLVLVVPWLIWGAPQSAAPLVPLAVATVAVGRYAALPPALLGIPVAVLVIAAQLATDPLQSSVAAGSGWLVLGPALWSLGAWLRKNDELEQRRETEQRERTRAAVAEERVRIAREMHDVLAHTLTVMVVQAEAAEDVLGRDPEAARTPLQRVHTTGREALRDVRRVLAVLRDADEPEHSLSAARLCDLEDLVERSRQAGVSVELHMNVLAEPPADVCRALYRVCQETLTNVLRHAGKVAARVEVDSSSEEVRLWVENEGPPASLGSGHGLLGMRERVEGLGGELTAEPRAQGGFSVTARIPMLGSR